LPRRSLRPLPPQIAHLFHAFGDLGTTGGEILSRPRAAALLRRSTLHDAFIDWCFWFHGADEHPTEIATLGKQKQKRDAGMLPALSGILPSSF